MQTKSKLLNCSSEKALRETLSKFETAYLSKSLSRLFDPINLVFSKDSMEPPTSQEVDSVVKTMSRWVSRHVTCVYPPDH